LAREFCGKTRFHSSRAASGGKFGCVSDFIDKWMESVESGGQFGHCTKCARALDETTAPWTVNKEWHRGECVMEYAICHDCRNDMVASISAESMRHVERFFERVPNLSHWLMATVSPDDPESLVERCFTCGVARDEAEGFGISAMFCAPGVLEIGPLPLLVCHGCSGKLEEGLSKETRDSWRRFVEEYFPGPPGMDEPSPHVRMPAFF